MTRRKHLEAYKVVDFSAVFAGPICSRYLLDCGAEVVKVETPEVGDITRGVDGITRVFAHFNAGKRSIALDLKKPAAQALARQLIADADVVIENFRPGIMAKFGLDYESLKSDGPDLVYCSISGFGQSGPFVDRAAYAPIVHAASGFDKVHTLSQGEDENRPPNWEIMVADILTGALAFGAIQSALLGRQRSGLGEHIDISMMESMMSLIPAHIQGAQMEEPPVIGRFYPVRTQDGFVMLCIVSDKNLQCLAAALNRDELLEDPRFIRGQRHLHFDQLVSEVEKWSTTLSCEACETALNRAGVPCSIYQRTEDLFVHPQVVDRNSFTTLTNDELGTFLIQNMPVKFSHIDTTAASWVARLGEHTDEVLAEKLSLQQSEIDVLRTSKVIS
ncbi:MAG TPA: carnitine dehydratase [Gammaproteobacteria bacterium]|jgi:crotonobetainyl-CoA:carnitine CoA-transferase CaiB-like acyl-CoA transferase|nr:CaiB/BaiF CoA-transferase family protein [Gammaproteobacteria bacterium]MDP6732907.1 CaiB/BaiF CoA-transferase family protein [Gammaproteobacteria bacterium]HAJ76769.1 carnitine dehydratase [Gammaproteobacteria bacterium]